jgi:hypothetical protein
MRVRVGEREAAAVGRASAHGRLIDYEASVRGLVGEAVPLDEAPPALADQASRAVTVLDELVERFQSSVSPAVPAPNTISLALRNAAHLHFARSIQPDGEVTIPPVRERAAAADAPHSARTTWQSSKGSLRVEARRGVEYLELWIVSDDQNGRPLVPLKLSGERRTEYFYALLARTDDAHSAGRLGYLHLPVADDHLRIEIGETQPFDGVQPTDAAVVAASISATGRSWRELWFEHIDILPWLASLGDEAFEDHARD